MTIKLTIDEITAAIAMYMERAGYSGQLQVGFMFTPPTVPGQPWSLHAEVVGAQIKTEAAVVAVKSTAN